MSRSLQWKLIATFGLLIGLTLSLSGGIAFWMTTNQFELLVTDESRRRVENLAPLLEASYAYQGNWSGLETLFKNAPAVAGLPAVMLSPGWVSGVDWLQVTAQALDLDRRAVASAYYGGTSNLATLAQERGVEAGAVGQAIFTAEQHAAESAIRQGSLTGGQGSVYMDAIPADVKRYVGGPAAPGWFSIVADQLAISPAALGQAIEAGQTIVDIARQRHVLPGKLVDAILNDEIVLLRSIQGLSESEIALQLANTSTAAWDFVDPSRAYRAQARQNHRGPAFTQEGVYWLMGTLLAGDERLLVTDANGSVVYDSTGALNPGTALPQAMLNKGILLWNYARTEQIGTAILAAGPGYYNAQQATFLRNVGQSLLVSGLVAAGLALLAGFVFTRRITAPATALTRAAQRLAEGNWAIRVPVSAQDELGQMSCAFNAMAAALESQRALRSRLINDLSHEFNTPLSVIQLELEALRDELQTPGEAVAHVEREIELLRNLLEDLTLLAETDAERLQLNRAPVDLAALTVEAIERWRPQAAAAGIALMCTVAQPLPRIDADSLRLTQVLGNLLSNAIRHTPPGGRIEISCQLTPTGVTTHVADTGEGIPAGDLPHIFDRFYRVDRSRSRHTGGRGLGLAIVRQVIELHGGTVWAESKPGGSLFGYRLPVPTTGVETE